MNNLIGRKKTMTKKIITNVNHRKKKKIHIKNNLQLKEKNRQFHKAFGMKWNLKKWLHSSGAFSLEWRPKHVLFYYYSNRVKCIIQKKHLIKVHERWLYWFFYNYRNNQGDVSKRNVSHHFFYCSWPKHAFLDISRLEINNNCIF